MKNSQTLTPGLYVYHCATPMVANHISNEVGDFAPGQQVVVSPMGTSRIGAFICYESVLPNFVRQFAANGEPESHRVLSLIVVGS